MVAKLSRANEILLQQQSFARQIAQARQQHLNIFYMDETSASLWNPLKERTWTNGLVTLPLQSRRGSGRTVIGAVGGNAN